MPRTRFTTPMTGSKTSSPKTNRAAGKRRSSALAEFNDNASIELLSEQIGKDGDHGLRLLATQLLGEATNPRAAKALEKRLSHPDEAVRLAALNGLRKQLGEGDLRPLDLALKTDQPDIGQVAVEAAGEVGPQGRPGPGTVG